MSASGLPHAGYAAQPPLQHFLDQCHQEIKADRSGVVASYIPELQNADPEHFGISIATIDGHIYEAGDSNIPFTI